ncbi:hypothetical protein GEMRC1_007156 [Eukaryota sp. GEM-RC1]
METVDVLDPVNEEIEEDLVEDVPKIENLNTTSNSVLELFDNEVVVSGSDSGDDETDDDDDASSSMNDFVVNDDEDECLNNQSVSAINSDLIFNKHVPKLKKTTITTLPKLRPNLLSRNTLKPNSNLPSLKLSKKVTDHVDTESVNRLPNSLGIQTDLENNLNNTRTISMQTETKVLTIVHDIVPLHWNQSGTTSDCQSHMSLKLQLLKDLNLLMAEILSFHLNDRDKYFNVLSLTNTFVMSILDLNDEVMCDEHCLGILDEFREVMCEYCCGIGYKESFSLAVMFARVMGGYSSVS